MGQIILVTGATGFIGKVLVAYLKKRGDAPRILVRPESDSLKAQAMGVDICEAGYDDHEKLREAVSGVDSIIHLAGVTRSVTREGYFQGNVMPVENLLRAFVDVNSSPARFVFVSSLAAAGPAPVAGEGLRETDPPLPVSGYGRSKLDAEHLCLSYRDKLPVTIVRPPAVYGPGDRDVLQFLQLLKKGLVLGAGDVDRQRLSLIHVEDLVEGIVMAARSPAAVGETYYITSPEWYSWDQLAAVAARELGVATVRKISLPKPLMRLAGTIAGFAGIVSGKTGLLNPDKVNEMVQDYWICSPRKAEKELGFIAKTPLEEGMRRTIAWYREEGWL